MIQAVVRTIVTPFFFLFMLVDKFGRGLCAVGLWFIGIMIAFIVPAFIAVKMGGVSVDVIRLLAGLGFFGVIAFSVGMALSPPQDSR